jgi:threonine/homoserine/homoserine lactone efflux protein
MLGIENYILFMMTALFFIMIPGIDTVFVLNKTITRGRRSGFVSAIGVNAGILTHTVVSALGLTAILSKSEIGMMAIQYIGAAYLVFMGIKQLNNKTEVFQNSKITEKSKNDFWAGFSTNSLNPKVALFFLALFPQFIVPTRINDPQPFLLLGFTYAVIGIIWYMLLTLCASTFSNKIRNNATYGLWINRVSGLVFILMGLQIALGK